MASTIEKYFPSLSDVQRAQFDTMLRAYPEWNEKINVISRQDVANVEVHHLLHSLAIAKFLRFTPGSRILDFGTGGGLPGLPLAVIMPDCHFVLIDRTGKKISVARSIAQEAGLTNVEFIHGDVAEFKDKVDFVVSRAVMPQPDLVKISRKNISETQHNAMPNGLITLKGGNLEAELRPVRAESMVVPVSQYFDELFFEGKHIVYTQIVPQSKRTNKK